MTKADLKTYLTNYLLASGKYSSAASSHLARDEDKENIRTFLAEYAPAGRDIKEQVHFILTERIIHIILARRRHYESEIECWCIYGILNGEIRKNTSRSTFMLSCTQKR